MAESSLALSRTELRSQVGHYMGWGTDSANWTSDQGARLTAIVDQGLRQFYWHEPLDISPSHEWSFLHPVALLRTAAPYSTGTIAYTLDSTTVTLTTGTWPTWAAKGVLLIGSVAYPVKTRSSDSVVLLETAYLGATATGQTYSINQETYDLPDDFGSLEGPITYSIGQNGYELTERNESYIRAIRQDLNTIGRPSVCSIRPKRTDGVAGSRSEILFWPTPDAAYDFEIPYSLLPDTVSASYPYPYGGTAHAQTILASCLAIAEQRENDVANGPESMNYKRLLLASVRNDMRKQPKSLGYVGDGATRREPYDRSNHRVTYNGTFYT